MRAVFVRLLLCLIISAAIDDEHFIHRMNKPDYKQVGLLRETKPIDFLLAVPMNDFSFEIMTDRVSLGAVAVQFRVPTLFGSGSWNVGKHLWPGRDFAIDFAIDC